MLMGDIGDRRRSFHEHEQYVAPQVPIGFTPHRRRSETAQAELNTSSINIGILCPLLLELEAVLATFDEAYDELYEQSPTSTMSTYYYTGRVGEHDVVAACLRHGNIGERGALELAVDMLQTFPTIQQLCLVGIAGALPRPQDTKFDVRLGDVVIGTHFVKCDEGKWREHGVLESTGIPWEGPDVLLDHLNKFFQRRDSEPDALANHLEKMKERAPKRAEDWTYRGREQDVLFHFDSEHLNGRENDDCQKCVKKCRRTSRTERENMYPRIFTGLIISGAQVVRNGKVREDLRKQHQNSLAVEMEAAALKRYRPIIVRGICDYADTHKHKAWQGYGAAAAAACLKELLYTIKLPPPRRGSLRAEFSAPTSVPGWGAEVPDGRITITADVNQFAGRVVFSEGVEASIDCAKTSGFGAKLHLYVSLDEDISKTTRHVMIHPEDPGQPPITLWIPSRGVQLERLGRSMTIRFANCAKGKLETHDGVGKFQGHWNPQNPNVTVELILRETHAAEELEHELLCDDILMPHSRKEMGQYEVVVDAKLCELSIYRCRESQYTTLTYQVLGNETSLNAFYLQKLQDFTLNISQAKSALQLKGLRQIEYSLKDYSSPHWPPYDWEEAGHDGGATDVRFEAAAPVDLELPRDKVEALLKSITSCDLLFVANAARVDFGKRSFKTPKSPESLITLWSAANSVRIVVRLQTSDDGAVEWLLWTKNEQNPATPTVYLEGKNLVQIDALYWTTSEPNLETDTHELSEPEQKKLCITFAEETSTTSFIDSIGEHLGIEPSEPALHRQESGLSRIASLGRRSRRNTILSALGRSSSPSENSEH